MERHARVPDGGSPAPLKATEIQLKETIDSKDNSPQIRRVFTVLPFTSRCTGYESMQAPSVRCRTKVKRSGVAFRRKVFSGNC